MPIVGKALPETKSFGDCHCHIQVYFIVIKGKSYVKEETLLLKRTRVMSEYPLTHKTKPVHCLYPQVGAQTDTFPLCYKYLLINTYHTVFNSTHSGTRIKKLITV